MDEPIPYSPDLQGKGPLKPTLTTLQRAEFIRGVDIFSHATVEELFRLASIAQEVRFAPQEVIFREGDVGDALYPIIKGQVELSCNEKGRTEVVGAGQAFGLYSVLTREPRYATAKAVEDTLALRIGGEDLYTLLSNNMEIVASIFKHFAKTLGVSPRR